MRTAPVTQSEARARCDDARKPLTTDMGPMAPLRAVKTVKQIAAGNSLQTVAGLWLEAGEPRAVCVIPATSGGDLTLMYFRR